jgi:hypothetical protein
MADSLVRVRAFVGYVFGRGFEKVRNDHRFENWMRFEKLKKDIDLRHRCCDVEIDMD